MTRRHNRKEDLLEEISSSGYGRHVTPAEARIEIRRRAIARRVRFSPHALERMNQRFVRPPDVYSALESITSCKRTEQERWRVAGPDRDGDELTLVVVLEADVVVITVF